MPSAVRGAAAIVALEGIGVLALGPLVFVGGILLSRPESLSRAWAAVVMAIASGALILFLARALTRLAGWSRGPIVVIQLLAAPLGLTLVFSAGRLMYGIVVLGASGAVLYLLFTPAAQLAFNHWR